MYFSLWFYTWILVDLFVNSLFLVALTTLLCTVILMPIVSTFYLTMIRGESSLRILFYLVSHVIGSLVTILVYTGLHNESTNEGDIVLTSAHDLKKDLAVSALRLVSGVTWMIMQKLKLIRELDTLKQQKVQLETELKAKQNFYKASIKGVSNMLQTLLIPLELAFNGNSSEEEKSSGVEDPELCAVSKLSGKIILVKIANALDYRQIYNHSLKLVLKLENLKEKIYEAHALFQILAKEKGICFSLLLDTNVPDFLLCDGTRFTQILTNFLLHSFTSTIKGEISVHVEWCDDHSVEKFPLCSKLRSAPEFFFSILHKEVRGENGKGRSNSLDGIVLA